MNFTDTHKKQYKIAIVAPVPFYYHVPLYRNFSTNPALDLTVIYCSDETLKGLDVKKMYQTKGNMVDQHDLLKGYSFKFLKNYSFNPSFVNWPFGLMNFGIWSEIQKGNYDMVILQAWTNVTWFIAFVACLVFRTKIAFMTDSNVLAESSKSPVKKFLKKILLEKLLFSKTTGFLTSGTANELFYQYYGVPKDKLVRIPFSWGYKEILVKAESLRGQRDALRTSSHITEDDLVMLYVGRFSQEKSPLTILEAFSKIDPRGKKLFLVGDGPQRQELERAIQKLNLRNVSLVGFKPREEVFQFYTMADVLLLPSLAETWGIVINEAMCFNLPIISSDKVGANLNLVQDGRNGFIFKSGDADDLAAKINQLAHLPQKERELFDIQSKKIITEWIGLDLQAQLNKILNLLK